jgi:hypothetical protein
MEQQGKVPQKTRDVNLVKSLKHGKAQTKLQVAPMEQQDKDQQKPSRLIRMNTVLPNSKSTCCRNETAAPTHHTPYRKCNHVVKKSITHKKAFKCMLKILNLLLS